MLYSLDSILIEEERPKLNTQIALNKKAKLLQFINIISLL